MLQTKLSLKPTAAFELQNIGLFAIIHPLLSLFPAELFQHKCRIWVDERDGGEKRGGTEFTVQYGNRQQRSWNDADFIVKTWGRDCKEGRKKERRLCIWDVGKKLYLKKQKRLLEDHGFESRLLGCSAFFNKHHKICSTLLGCLLLLGWLNAEEKFACVYISVYEQRPRQFTLISSQYNSCQSRTTSLTQSTVFCPYSSHPVLHVDSFKYFIIWPSADTDIIYVYIVFLIPVLFYFVLYFLFHLLYSYLSFCTIQNYRTFISLSLSAMSSDK